MLAGKAQFFMVSTVLLEETVDRPEFL